MKVCIGALRYTEGECKNKHNKATTCEHYFPHEFLSGECNEKLCFFDLDSPFKYRRVGSCLDEFHFLLLKALKKEKNNARKRKSKTSNKHS